MQERSEKKKWRKIKCEVAVVTAFLNIIICGIFALERKLMQKWRSFHSLYIFRSSIILAD